MDILVKGVLAVPSILFIVGAIIFLLIAVAKKINGWIELDSKGRIIAGICGCIFFFLGWHLLEKKPQTNGQPCQSSESPRELTSLDEGQVRTQISNALQDDKVESAIPILRGLEGELKNEECQHMFDFCIKNGKLNEAEEVANQCWKGDARQQALNQIDLERLKQ